MLTNSTFSRVILTLIIIQIFIGCASVEKYNRQLNSLKTEKQLKSDIDYVYQKLQKYHPNLHWYLSKKDLDYKFDSLKSTINYPMSGYDFYFKLSPVIADIKQGHTLLLRPYKKLNKKEISETKTMGFTPFNAFQSELIDNKLYVIRYLRKDSGLKAGTEIVTINGDKPLDIFNKYKNTISADGFSQTYLSKLHNTAFASYFYHQHGLTDSVVCQLKYKDSVWVSCLKREPANISLKKSDENKRPELSKKQLKEKKNNDMIQGYDAVSKTYSKSLRFTGPDSSIAIMKLRDFTGGIYKKFYANSFKTLKTAKTKSLIIDLRNNGGGKLNDVYNLYSYLNDSDFYFIDKLVVNSRSSPLLMDYFWDKPFFKKIGWFFELQYRMLKAFSAQKNNNNEFCFPIKASRLGHPNKNRFDGKVYVIINGGSYSASCILSSNLKSTKRVTFVGEETRGEYNGCVSGYLPIIRLPESKLKLRFGLCVVKPYHKTNIDGYGVLPDFEVVPSLIDKINKIDTELNWILDDIKNKKE